MSVSLQQTGKKSVCGPIRHYHDSPSQVGQCTPDPPREKQQGPRQAKLEG